MRTRWRFPAAIVGVSRGSAAGGRAKSEEPASNGSGAEKKLIGPKVKMKSMEEFGGQEIMLPPFAFKRQCWTQYSDQDELCLKCPVSTECMYEKAATM